MSKKFLNFFIIQNFLCKYLKLFPNFKFIFHLIFWELPTIAGHRITQVYYTQIPLKLG